MGFEFKIKPLRQGFTIHFVFSRPILVWEGVGARFITALFDSMSPKIPIRPSEISFNNATVLGDIWVRYAIYGGASSIRLSSERLTLDFPSLTASDLPIALEILRIAHDTIPKLFPDQGCERIEAQVADHMDFVLPGAVHQFLERYSLPNVDEVFKEAAVTQLPSVRFGLVSEKEKWEYTFMAEHSQLSANAIFVVRTLILRPVDLSTSFETKLALAQSATWRCFAALGLEYVADAPST